MKKRSKIQTPDHANVGQPKTTSGAKHRKAPASTTLNKKTLKGSGSPESAHSKTNPGNKNRAAAKRIQDWGKNLGPYLHAKLPSGRKIGAVKSVAKAIKSTAKQRMY